MAIYKAKVESNYTIIPNATAQDKTLSFESRGLLALMLSLPDNWQIHKSWLESQSPSCGRDKLTRIMGELQDKSYIRKSNKRNQSGQMDGVDWFVYPTAQLKTRSTDLPLDGESPTIKETLIQSKQSNNKGKDLLSGKPDSILVLEYLNYSLSTKYKTTTKSHIENINARLADGHSVEDLKSVVDSKKIEWGKDPAMAQYLRPQTLFGNKFQGYLIAAKTAPKQPRDLNQITGGFEQKPEGW